LTRLFLDVHLSPEIASQLSAVGIDTLAASHWEGGRYRHASDEALLTLASVLRRVFVTYDQSTVPELLTSWAMQGGSHAGVILIDRRTIQPSDIGGLVRALRQEATKSRDLDWENRTIYLRRA
jgi:predicted nuclease of predicted toxin-antitoxin system